MSRLTVREATELVERLQEKLKGREKENHDLHDECDQLHEKLVTVTDQLHAATEECDKYAHMYADVLTAKNKRVRQIALEVSVLRRR